VQQFQIDSEHSNGFAAWQRIGSPQSPTPAQREQLEKADDLAPVGGQRSIEIVAGKGGVRVTLPRQAVTLLVFDLE
jgi:xylan 1,4-beta-xylosidase